MWLAAAIASLTAAGAFGGATARPSTSSEPQVALVLVPSGAGEVQPAPQGTGVSAVAGVAPRASAMAIAATAAAVLFLVPIKTPGRLRLLPFVPLPCCEARGGC